MELPEKESHMSEIIRVDCPPVGEFSLLTSPANWLSKTNIQDYARRQAESCEYLEKLFPVIERRIKPYSEIVISDLLSPLLKVHRRQFKELTATLPSYLPEDRESYYFNFMYRVEGLNHPLDDSILTKDEVFKLLLIHGFSYIRGADRYNLLKEYQDSSNDPYRSVWKDFYQDASSNWKRTWKFIGKNFSSADKKPLIENVVLNETDLMREIWKYKGIKNTL